MEKMSKRGLSRPCHIEVKNYTGLQKRELRLRFDEQLKFRQSRLILVINRIGRNPYVSVRTRKIYKSFSRWALEQLSGESIPGGMEVHHIDAKPLHNRYNNFLVVSLEEHVSLHRMIEEGRNRGSLSEYRQAVRRLRGRMKRNGYIVKADARTREVYAGSSPNGTAVMGDESGRRRQRKVSR